MKLIARLLSKAYHRRYISRLRRLKGLQLGPGIVIHGRPVIDIRKGGKIIVEDGVTLNSLNLGYHASMYGPVKLYADQPNATIRIGEKTRINGACLHAYSSITIGKNCLIAANCQIIDSSGHDLSFENVDNRINTMGGSKPISIGDSVWLGLNVIVLPGVTIGRGAVIGAGSVVTRDIPPMTVAAGNPAKVIKMATHDAMQEASIAAGLPAGAASCATTNTAATSPRP